MSWVTEARDASARGERVAVRPIGGSMRGRIESGDLVVLEPALIGDLVLEDVVFVCWRRNYLLDVVKEIETGRILIGNNLGKINGWVPAEDILGKAVSVGTEPPQDR